MSPLAEFAAQLARCAQTPEEIRSFVEAFSQLRLRYIAGQLTAPRPASSAALAGAVPVKPNWTDSGGLLASGLTPKDVVGLADPGVSWLHVDVAGDRSSAARALVAAFVVETCVSDKQRKALFPSLSALKLATPEALAKRLAEVPFLNNWLRWCRSEGIRPDIFGDYQRNLRIHGASQNAGGGVGAVGGAIAIVDALKEITNGRGMELLGALPPSGERDPLSVDSFLRKQGLSPDGADRPLKCVLLSNHRAVIFASDPDVAIIQSLKDPFKTAQGAWDVYSAVRGNSALRAQRVHEFAVGETKTATDASNLHERMALSTRETRSERQADRFLMMAILTADILTGAAGATGRRNTRAPMQAREMGRVTDVFNLHHAWGWDGGRDRHPEHWEWFKGRLKGWTGL